jgi:hypothetical protein
LPSTTDWFPGAARAGGIGLDPAWLG